MGARSQTDKVRPGSRGSGVMDIAWRHRGWGRKDRCHRAGGARRSGGSALGCERPNRNPTSASFPRSYNSALSPDALGRAPPTSMGRRGAGCASSIGGEMPWRGGASFPHALTTSPGPAPEESICNRANQVDDLGIDSNLAEVRRCGAPMLPAGERSDLQSIGIGRCVTIHQVSARPRTTCLAARILRGDRRPHLARLLGESSKLQSQLQAESFRS